MLKVLNYLKKNICNFCTILIAALIFSCSNSAPDLIVTTGTVVLDYRDEKSFPEVKLSVFTNAKSDSRRAQSFSIENVESGLEWKSFSPQIYQVNNIFWFGYSNFKAPEGQDFPTGRYRLLYTDYSQDEATNNFVVSYPKDALKAKSSEIRAKINGSADEKIALYDKDDNLIYFDKRKSSWDGWDSIEKEYDFAVKSRIVYIEKDQSVMVLLPFDFKDN